MPASIALDSVAKADEAQRIQLLDDPQEWAAFSLPEKTRAGCWSSSVVFEGMHCAACAITLEDALRSVPGVDSVQINAASHRGRIVWSPEMTRPSAWMRSVERFGYKAIPANDAHAHERRRQEARRMVWRLAVAALCMMQVMMYATPVYVSEPGDITPEMVHLLRWASWVLSLPVVFFSCTPFLRSAWRDLYVALGEPVSATLLSIGIPAGAFVDHGSVSDLRTLIGLDEAGIERQIRAAWGARRAQ